MNFILNFVLIFCDLFFMFIYFFKDWVNFEELGEDSSTKCNKLFC